MSNSHKERKISSYSDAEREAINIFTPILSHHIGLTQYTLNVIGTALSLACVKNTSTSQRVVTVLMARLANDIRSASLLALKGYAVQAASLIATVYELTYTIAFIGSNDEVAKEWVKHNDVTRPFRKVLTLTKTGLKNLSVPDPKRQVGIEYGIYQQLCLPKHANPLFQKYHSIRVEGAKAVVVMGPDTSEAAIRDSWFALQHAARLAYLALRSIAENHIPPAVQGDLWKQIERIGAKVKELDDQASNRWENGKQKK